MSGRWPGNFCLTHIPDLLTCVSCQTAYPMQPIIEVCPDCGGELEFVMGCRRVGIKKVKNADCKGEPSDILSQGQIYGGGQHNTTYADPDGLEAVDDWRCMEPSDLLKKKKTGQRKLM